MSTEQKYWIWSIEHKKWLERISPMQRKGNCWYSYSPNIKDAGVFTGDEPDLIDMPFILIPCSPLASPTIPDAEIRRAGCDWLADPYRKSTRGNPLLNGFITGAEWALKKFSASPTKKDDQESSQLRQPNQQSLSSIQEQIHCLKEFLQGLGSSLQLALEHPAIAHPLDSDLKYLIRYGLIDIQHHARHTLARRDDLLKEKTDQSHTLDQDRQDEHQEEWQNPQGIKSEACLKLLQDQEYERKRKEYFEMMNQQITQHPYYQRASAETKPEPAKPEESKMVSAKDLAGMKLIRDELLRHPKTPWEDLPCLTNRRK